MKALITGAGGFLGQNLVNFLLDKDFEIFNLGKNPSKDCIHCSLPDISDESSINEHIRRIKPDYLFHFAGTSNAISDLSECFRVNAIFASDLFSAIKKSDLQRHTKIIILGTAAEYGLMDRSHMPLSEVASTNPVSPYGISKLAQTFFAKAEFKNFQQLTVIRPFNIIGPKMPVHLALGNFINQIISPEESVKLKTGNIDTARDFIDVNDLIQIMWRLVNNRNAHAEIINVCSGSPVSIRDMVNFLIKNVNKTVVLEKDKNRFKENDIKIHFGNNKKLMDLIGDYEFISWKETIIRIIKHHGL